jgi:hypothetical protein
LTGDPSNLATVSTILKISSTKVDTEILKISKVKKNFSEHLHGLECKFSRRLEEPIVEFRNIEHNPNDNLEVVSLFAIFEIYAIHSLGLTKDFFGG